MYKFIKWKHSWCYHTLLSVQAGLKNKNGQTDRRWCSNLQRLEMENGWREDTGWEMDGWMVEQVHNVLANELIFTAAWRWSLCVSGVCSWAWEMRVRPRPAWEQGRTSRQQREHTHNRMTLIYWGLKKMVGKRWCSPRCWCCFLNSGI